MALECLHGVLATVVTKRDTRKREDDTSQSKLRHKKPGLPSARYGFEVFANGLDSLTWMSSLT